MKEDLKKARKVILVGQARLKEIEAEGKVHKGLGD